MNETDREQPPPQMGREGQEMVDKSEGIKEQMQCPMDVAQDRTSILLPFGVYLSKGDMTLHCVYRTWIRDKTDGPNPRPLRNPIRQYMVYDAVNCCCLDMTNMDSRISRMVSVRDAAVIAETKMRMMEYIRDRKKTAEALVKTTEEMLAGVELF